MVVRSHGSCPQALSGAQEAHGCSVVAVDVAVGRVAGRGENSVPSEGLLVDRNIVRQSAEEVQFTLDPSQDLLGGHKDLQVSESD